MIFLRRGTLSKISLIGAVIILACSPLWAAEDFAYKAKGYVMGRAYQDVKDDTPFEKQHDLEGRARLENELTLKDWDALAFVAVEARGEAFFNDKTAKDADFLLREAYVEVRKPHFSCTIGRQVLTWGKLDDIVILDRLNPQDYRRFIMYNKQERKEPVFMFRHSYFGKGFEIESVFIPEFRASNLQYFGTDWSAYDHLIQGVEEGEYSEGTKGIIRKIRTEEKESLTDRSLKNAQGGMRLRTRIGEVDWGFYYMNLLQSLSTLREKSDKGLFLKRLLNFPTADNLAALIANNPADFDLALEEEHPRMHVAGFDWEAVAGEWGVRGEAAFLSGHPYCAADMSYAERNTLMAGIGADHTTANNLSLNVQFIETYILNYKPLFPDEEFSHQVTATLSKDFLRGDLTCTLKHTFNISYKDWMLNPKVSYKFKNGLQATLGSFLFEGGPTTVFGRYSNQDVIYLEAKIHF